jgi:hypothetical protein
VMKHFLLSVLWCVCAALAVADEMPSYLVVAPEGMDHELVDRVSSWMENNLFYPVRVQRVAPWAKTSGEDQITRILSQIESPGMVTVILTDYLPEEKHALIQPERMAGLIHVPLLVPEIKETTLRRLDRQAIRVVGFCLEIPPQPIPFCALHPYQTMDELDAMGRGFSPPAMAFYRKQLQVKGFALSPEAAENLPEITLPLIPSPPSQE